MTISKQGEIISIESYENVTKLNSKTVMDNTGIKNPLIKLPEYDVVKKEFEEGHGCRITGMLKVNKVIILN